MNGTSGAVNVTDSGSRNGWTFDIGWRLPIPNSSFALLTEYRYVGLGGNTVMIPGAVNINRQSINMFSIGLETDFSFNRMPVR